ncbi:MAG: amino acid ABC transporter permease [Oscillospiraceae bacterium]|nr:amino acid ABC transporter permease [Oscillospiraceae bacterium]
MEKLIKILIRYYPVFLHGLWGTLWLAAATVLLGTVLGLVVAILRMSRIKAFNTIAGIYIEILRGTPILLQLYFFWLMLPKIMPFKMTDTGAILVALIINASAYISEIIRAGIAAVDPGQWEAARSLGLSEKNVMRRIILPQAVKNILPALCNEFIAEVKGTSLASVFFVRELTTAYKTVQSTTFLAVQPLLISGMIYLIVTTVLSWAVRRLERRLKASD